MALIPESEAARSLLLTRSVAGTLREDGWQVVEGAFSSRGAVDIAAKRSWTNGKGTTRLTLAILSVAVASAKRQLLFSASPGRAGEVKDSLPRFTLGDDDPTQREAIRSTLDRHLDSESAQAILQTLHDAAYPKGETLAQAAPLVAPAARTYATGFREADEAGRVGDGPFTLAVGNAFESVEAIHDDLLRFELDVLADDLQVAEAQEQAKLATAALLSGASRSDCIHPIVVTDAPLAILGDAATIVVRPWLRLARQPLVSAEHRWIDVVNEAALPRYAAMLTKHYDARFKRRRFTRQL